MLTYLDMAVRGRPASAVPAHTVERGADAIGVDLAPPGDDHAGRHRSEGIGALLGYAAGLGLGALYGALRSRADAIPVPAAAAGLTLAAMAGPNLPSVVMGVTDPREWGAEGWLADIVPHLLYGVVTAGVYHAIER